MNNRVQQQRKWVEDYQTMVELLKNKRTAQNEIENRIKKSDTLKRYWKIILAVITSDSFFRPK